MVVRLPPTETLFVEAVRREFGFLTREYGFAEKPLVWSGEGISVNHLSRTIEVSNFLEAHESYTTFIFPLRDGSRLPVFDQDMDEHFAYFFPEELLNRFPIQRGVASAAFPDRDELLRAVATRAALLREHIKTLLLDDGTLLGNIRDRRRERALRELVPKWIEFVDQVRRGYAGPGSAYVAGVNIRGEIRSLLSWPGTIPPTLERELREADAQFDAATEPIAFDAGAVRVLPHPRATRWFRRPKGGGSFVSR